ncbi:MAG: protein kinase [Polyangiaceae bacterium]|jgi:serine/threonine-protein kinase
MTHAGYRDDERRSPGLGGGTYRLIAELGQGGMATVYLAVVLGSSGFRKLAVVKVLRPEFVIDPEFVQMFLDEARLSARLNHPNIVQTYDVWEGQGQHMMAMEYLDGVSLQLATARLSKAGTPMEFAFRATVLLDVLEGLRYAHELTDYDGKPLNVVHRDVTPHNIFVTYDGQAKLLDFGIAKAATSSVRTATGVIKGKITYMSPEQAVGDAVDARTDLFAVGVMLWEAVTGRRRWPAGISEPALFTKLVSGELPERPGAASRGYPPELDDIVMRAIAPNREDRFPTAAEFRDALQGALRALGPVSLRDLGSVLGKTFAVERQRLRSVIEEQFRLMDSGNPPPDTHALPSVSQSVLNTMSESIQRSLESPRSVPATLTARPPPNPPVERDGDVISSDDSVRQTRLAPSRRLILGIAAGVLMATVAALGALGAQLFSRAASTPKAAADSALDSGPLGTLPATPAVSASTAPEAAPVWVAPVQAATVAPARVAPPPRAPGGSRPAEGRGVPPPIASATSAPMPSSAPAPTATAIPDVPLPRKEIKPKVQLDPDNPWP